MRTRTLAIGLFVSLAVNLFLVGAIAGGLLVRQRLMDDAPPAMRQRQPLVAAGQTLEPEHRRAYFRLLRGEVGDVHAGMGQARAARAAAWGQLEQERFDAAAVKKSLAEARARELAIRAEVEGRIVDFASTLPARERAELARGLAKAHPGPMVMRHRLHAPPPPEGEGPRP